MLQRENLLTRLKQQYNTMSKGQKCLTLRPGWARK